ncbi:alpha/beta hydrolase [Asanoa siamensis]|uniref:Phospholipase n=1 Tax=Asanoa siamensis TaxID=926357 RepID=A0ABQ4D412_9ACTN|nr:dienelactone hydrolase family protein [Asanoa siamensis]GIF77857.1 phospholipase [Asanoa siamensis]
MTVTTTVVVLHSKYSDPDEYEAIFGPLVADLPARLVLPRAPFAARDGYSWFPSASGAAHANLVSAGCDRLAVDVAGAGPLVVTGASQGGDLAFALALRHPGLVTAALPMLGLCPPSLWPTAADRCPPIHAFHGEADPIVAIDDARRVADGLGRRGARISLHTYPGLGHDFSAAMLADWRTTVTDVVTAAGRGEAGNAPPDRRSRRTAPGRG